MVPECTRAVSPSQVPHRISHIVMTKLIKLTSNEGSRFASSPIGTYHCSIFVLPTYQIKKKKKKKKNHECCFLPSNPFLESHIYTYNYLLYFWLHIIKFAFIFYIFYYVYFFINNLSIQLFLIFFISRVTKFDFTFWWFCAKSTEHEFKKNVILQINCYFYIKFMKIAI